MSKIRNKFWVLIWYSVTLCLFSSLAQAHTYKASLLLDTDMALDDMRAIAMLFNSDMVLIPLIIASDGAASPDAGCRNLATLLRYFNKEGTLIAKGKVLDKPAPPWRPWSENINWPDAFRKAKNTSQFLQASEAIVKTLNSSEDGILYLCLGPLTNLSEALALSADIRNKITRIIYYGGHPDDLNPGWNTSRDLEAARSVFGSGIEIYAMNPQKDHLLPFDVDLLRQISDLETMAAHLVKTVYQDPDVEDLLFKRHFYVWDEMTVIFLSNPSLFTFSPSIHAHVMKLQHYEEGKIFNTYLKLFDYSGDFHLHSRNSVVLKKLPTDPSGFKEDVSPYVEGVIKKYGLEEWKACLLTNEFHRHLGIYSLIGAKMGIRAREILEAPFDTLEVVSSAGNRPPLSCMNDGLQVSTGASLGRGTINVLKNVFKPEASFIFHNRKITLKIKKNIVGKIKADIKKALEDYGGLTPEYFSYIRKLSLNCWLDLDRSKIFDEFETSADIRKVH